MICEKCGAEMFIDTWGGWVWTCVGCDHIGRAATIDEVEQLEKVQKCD